MNIGRVGKSGEDMVAAFLRKNGYKIAKRNYSCRFGEIDIIAERKEYIVFVEVKTRTIGQTFPPRAAVNAEKRRKIILASQAYIKHKNINKTQEKKKFPPFLCKILKIRDYSIFFSFFVTKYIIAVTANNIGKPVNEKIRIPILIIFHSSA